MNFIFHSKRMIVLRILFVVAITRISIHVEINSYVKEINDTNFERIINDSKCIPAIVEFYHPECGYCKQFGPIYENMAKELKNTATFLSYRIDINSKYSKMFKIAGVPSLIMFNGMNNSKSILSGRDSKTITRELRNFTEHKFINLKEKEFENSIADKEVVFLYIGKSFLNIPYNLKRFSCFQNSKYSRFNKLSEYRNRQRKIGFFFMRKLPRKYFSNDINNNNNINMDKEIEEKSLFSLINNDFSSLRKYLVKDSNIPFKTKELNEFFFRTREGMGNAVIVKEESCFEHFFEPLKKKVKGKRKEKMNSKVYYHILVLNNLVSVTNRRLIQEFEIAILELERFFSEGETSSFFGDLNMNKNSDFGNNNNSEESKETKGNSKRMDLKYRKFFVIDLSEGKGFSEGLVLKSFKANIPSLLVPGFFTVHVSSSKVKALLGLESILGLKKGKDNANSNIFEKLNKLKMFEEMKNAEEGFLWKYVDFSELHFGTNLNLCGKNSVFNAGKALNSFESKGRTNYIESILESEFENLFRKGFETKSADKKSSPSREKKSKVPKVPTIFIKVPFFLIYKNYSENNRFVFYRNFFDEVNELVRKYVGAISFYRVYSFLPFIDGNEKNDIFFDRKIYYYINGINDINDMKNEINIEKENNSENSLKEIYLKEIKNLIEKLIGNLKPYKEIKNKEEFKTFLNDKEIKNKILIFCDLEKLKEKLRVKVVKRIKVLNLLFSSSKAKQNNNNNNNNNNKLVLVPKSLLIILKNKVKGNKELETYFSKNKEVVLFVFKVKKDYSISLKFHKDNFNLINCISFLNREINEIDLSITKEGIKELISSKTEFNVFGFETDSFKTFYNSDNYEEETKFLDFLCKEQNCFLAFFSKDYEERNENEMDLEIEFLKISKKFSGNGINFVVVHFNLKKDLFLIKEIKRLEGIYVGKEKGKEEIRKMVFYFENRGKLFSYFNRNNDEEEESLEVWIKSIMNKEEELVKNNIELDLSSKLKNIYSDKFGNEKKKEVIVDEEL